MISLEPEIRSLSERKLLSPDLAAKLAALERREILSVHNELRIALWLAVVLLTTGVGLFLKNNVDRIGHATLIALIALAAVACYLVVWRRRRAGSTSSALDYLLLLGALLLSADVGYAEAQFHFFGATWRHHFLILATIHAATAYAFDSRMVLTLSITSLAAWFGIDNRGEFFARDESGIASRFLAVAGVTLIWRALNTRIARLDRFDATFDHFIAHFALAGSLILSFDNAFEWIGLLLLATLVALAVIRGVRTRREAFVLYGFVYGVMGLDGLILRHAVDELGFLWIIVTTPIAIAALFMIHRHWRTEW